MRTSRYLASVSVLSCLALLAACGGGGAKYTIPSQDITVTSTALPLTLSGQSINYVLPLTGGCGGPYVLSVISGQLPPGMFLDNATRSIQGVALQAGNFAFTIQIEDTGCTPFSSTTAAFAMTIGVGPVAIVACDPAIFPQAAYNPPNTVKYTDVDGLKTTVFNQFAVFNFTVAGGTPPYAMDFVDDPADLLDGGLPLGISIPPFSTSMVGAPQQVLPGGVPFRITLRATDSLNQTGIRKVQWKIDTPPIIIATTTLPNGKCGSTYAQSIQIVDGVPPFAFEQTTTAPVPLNDIVYASPLAPTVDGGLITVNVVTGEANNKCTAANYPGLAVAGPYTGITPEGVFLREATGSFSGAPRRLGAFTFHVHVNSTLVPNEFGQHAWQSYTVTFANSEPPVVPVPAFSPKPQTWTTEGAATLLTAAPWSTLPEMEVGQPYNPDGGVTGLSLLAQGGVAKDGLTDAPHFSQVVNIDGTGAPPTFEFGGGYDWTINWDADSVGAPNPPAGVTFTTHTGVLSVPTPASLVGRGRTSISFTTSDQQLPTASKHTITGRAAYSIGPDKVIITESGTSLAATQATSSFNDHDMIVKVLSPLSSGALIRVLSNAQDLAGSIPSTTSITAIDTLLSNIDIMRVSINPTSNRDDVHGLNASGARSMQHGDSNISYTYSNPSWQSGSNPMPANPSATCVDLPAVPSVAHNPGAGIFNDGGRLYGFQGTGKFGIFIVRSNSSISVPVAFSTSGGFTGLGDATMEPYAADKHSLFQMVNMTVSPNGRFAAAKLKTNSSTGAGTFSESAATTKIVLFSLTGETPFSGASFKVIDTGSAGTATGGGIYQYGLSLALTDTYLYYLCGNYTNTYSSWKEHLIYRYQITGGGAAGALLAPSSLTGWVNSTGSIANMMQTPFQKYDTPTSISSSPSFATGGLTFVVLTTPNQEMYTYQGWNAIENGTSPMPFRVSTNGQACAILAGQEPNTTAGTSVMNFDVWVDQAGTLRKLSTTPRHAPNGGTRGYTLQRGTTNYYHWGRYSGPTTHFEISSDASKVAVVVNRQNTTVSSTSNANWYNFREDVVAYSTTNAWVTPTEVQVTGTETATAAVFGGSHLWRFGSLVFTKDNAGLIFWGGRNAQNSTVSTSYENSVRFAGTYYSYAFSGGTVKSIFATADGGSDVGLFTHDNGTNAVNPTAPGGAVPLEAAGRIRPYGGFLSKSGDFFYVVTLGAISGTEQRSTGLLGINIRSLNNAASINGKADGRGFLVAGQNARRGMLPVYYYLYYYSLDYNYYAPCGTFGLGREVVARNKGTVYYASHYQSNGPTVANSATSSFHAGQTNATYWGDYGTYAGQVEGFDPNLGGAVQRITLASLGTVDGTTNRSIHWIETNPTGSALAFVYDTGGTVRNYSTETAVYLQKIAFDPTTGALSAAPQQFVLTGGGRIGESMAIDSTGNRLYYAYGAGNENAKQLAEVTFNPATNLISTRTFGTPKRYNVLSSGR